MSTAARNLTFMNDTPELEIVARTRHDAFTPAVPTPRIGVPAPTPDATAHRKLVSEVLESTTRDLQKIAEQRRAAFSHTYSVEAASLYSVLTVVGAVLTVLLGIWLFNVGVDMEIGGE